MDITTTSLMLDGVEFKISEAFKVKHQIAAPNIHVKDVSVLLQQFNYDFTLEKHLVHTYELKQKQIEEEKRRQEIEKGKQENSPQSSKNHDQTKGMKQNNESGAQSNKQPKNSTNRFLNDMLGNDILTPQKYTSVHKDESNQRKRVDVHEFEDENLDPFTNAELQTIDDLKELKDVLQHVTMGGLATTSNAPPKPAPRIRRHSPTDKSDEVTTKLTKRHEDTDPTRKTRSDLTPLGSISDSATTVRLSPKLRRSSDNLAVDVSQSDVIPTASSLPLMSLGSMDVSPPAVSQLETAKSSQAASVSFDKSSAIANSNTSEIRRDLLVSDISSKNGRCSPTFVRLPSSTNDVDLNANVPVSKRMDVRRNEYVNVSVIKPQPAVLPKPVKKPRVHTAKTENSFNHDAQNQTRTSTTSAQNRVLANKSRAERAKFEETINKALTSLPTLPAISFAPKVSCSNSSVFGEATASKSSPLPTSILSGLTASERDFAEPIVAMGFKEEDVIRSMQKYDKDQKEEVLDHLIKLQCLSDKGFSTQNIEEALDLFQGNVEEAAKYLTLERQFLDMGFPNSKIKEALVLHNTDQQKSLEELMSGV